MKALGFALIFVVVLVTSLLSGCTDAAVSECTLCLAAEEEFGSKAQSRVASCLAYHATNYNQYYFSAGFDANGAWRNFHGAWAISNKYCRILLPALCSDYCAQLGYASAKYGAKCLKQIYDDDNSGWNAFPQYANQCDGDVSSYCPCG
jgi:hypothetical protein